MKNQAFTLIEVLIVVLIIGILAAIAVPQYKLAVLKSEYSKLKEYVETIYGSVQIYYLTNGIWPKKLTDLDIELPGKLVSNDTHIRVSSPAGIECWLWNTGSSGYVACSFTKFNSTIRYEHNFLGSNNRNCYTEPSAADTFAAKFCQIETGKTSTSGYYRY